MKKPDGRLTLSPSEATPEVVRLKDVSRAAVLRARHAGVDPMPPTDAELFDCRNLDDVKRLAARTAPPTPVRPPTFRAFLVSIRDEDTAAGDLARDALRDERWTGNTAGSLGAHMRGTGTACADAHRTYHEVVRRFALGGGQ